MQFPILDLTTWKLRPPILHLKHIYIYIYMYLLIHLISLPISLLRVREMNPTNYASYTLMPFLICFVHAIIISTFVTVSESSYSTSYEDHHFMRRVDNYRYNTLSSAAPSRPPLTVTLHLYYFYILRHNIIRVGIDWIWIGIV